eukprot:Lithocolla_globosa_v1_NODE_153_length_5670_cov_4.374889.p2 type:complete len:125 gc:universal NODE_153_length_5670_cov_4.374889:1258-1632(+)
MDMDCKPDRTLPSKIHFNTIVRRKFQNPNKIKEITKLAKVYFISLVMKGRCANSGGSPNKTTIWWLPKKTTTPDAANITNQNSFSNSKMKYEQKKDGLSFVISEFFFSWIKRAGLPCQQVPLGK